MRNAARYPRYMNNGQTITKADDLQHCRDGFEAAMDKAAESFGAEAARWLEVAARYEEASKRIAAA